MRQLKKIIWLVVLAIVVVVGLNRQTIFDFVRGKMYSPTPEVVKIRENLDLTPRGESLFNASMPELDSEEEFNQDCRIYDESVAVLGCYINQTIHVYHIKAKELDGILELTMAHELLHAAYERMPFWEKDEMKFWLESVYNKNRGVLGNEIEAYSSEEQLEEIYVRAGTEIKDLPERLEKHFAEFFKDQDKIVNFYEKYAKVFKDLEVEMEYLEKELDRLDAQIIVKTSEYESRVKKLNDEIDQFNNCADKPGCFGSDEDFYARRSMLVAERDEVWALYDELDELINQYNVDVEKYNNNVMRSENLQNIINSHVVVEGL